MSDRVEANPVVTAGIAYFALVFAVGFVLGTIRVFALIPAFGEWIGNLIELPVILLVSWVLCGSVIRRFAVPVDFRARATMGAIAFCLLMAAEIGLAVLLFGESLSEYTARLLSALGLLGLAGQLLFALFPLWRLR